MGMEVKGVRGAAVLWVVWFCSYMDEFLLRTLLQESLTGWKAVIPSSLLCALFWGTVSVLRWCPRQHYSHPRCQYLSDWYLPQICFLKLCAMFLLKVLSFPQPVWPTNACFLRFFQSLRFELCCGISWTYVPQLKLSVVGLCGTLQDGTGRACGRARSRWGQESVWAQVLPRTHVLGGAEQPPVHSQLWLCCVGSHLPWVCSAAHSVLPVLTHRWPFPCAAHWNGDLTALQNRAVELPEQTCLSLQLALESHCPIKGGARMTLHALLWSFLLDRILQLLVLLLHLIFPVAHIALFDDLLNLFCYYSSFPSEIHSIPLIGYSLFYEKMLTRYIFHVPLFLLNSVY